MAITQPTGAQVISMAIDRKLRAVGKALPGTVVSYDAVTETCVVRPGVNRLVPSVQDDVPDDFEELPALQDVPVMWPRARGFSLVGSLGSGDTVFLVCCDRDISGWRATGQPSDPEDVRQHSWGSVVAIPGLVPDTNPFTTPGDAAALASRVEAELNSLRSAIETLRLAYTTHTHTDPVSGSTGVPSAPDTTSTPAVGSVGSALLKLEE